MSSERHVLTIRFDVNEGEYRPSLTMLIGKATALWVDRRRLRIDGNEIAVDGMDIESVAVTTPEGPEGSVRKVVAPR